MADQKDPKQVVDSEVYALDSEASQTSRETVVVKPLKTWKGYLWDTWELPPDQRWLLFKVDAFVLTFASLGYFLKNIDQTNVNNAFLSGMKEDLNMYGNELVTSQSCISKGHYPELTCCYRHIHLDSRICHWPDSFQLAPHKSISSLGHTFS